MWWHRSSPTKTKSVLTGPSVKVNVAVAKITTKDEYNKYLPETRKDIGKCPACNQGAHNYTPKFPFGKADWPSNRLESCPQFLSKTVRERGELMERIQGCYKCTSWKHKGDACYLKSRANCTVVTAGSACSGVHHKLLHGSGVAFCHKVTAYIQQSNSARSSPELGTEELVSPPDLHQPVLLEVQSVKQAWR